MEIRPQRRRSLAGGRRSSSSGARRETTSRSFRARENHEPGNVRVLVPRGGRRGPGRHAPDGARLGRERARRAAVPGDRGEARADRGARRRRGRRDAHLRRQREAAARRQVLDARRAGGRQHQGAGARQRRRQEGGRTARRRRPRNCVEHSDARIDGRRHLEAHDSHAARRVAPALLGRRLAAGERAVRRDVRDAEVLREPDVRAGRRRRGGGAATPRRRRCPLHPRRGIRGQRSGQGLQSVGEGVEAPDRAVDLPRRTARGRSWIASRGRCR